MRIRIAVPDGALTPQIIEHALEATTLGNQQLLRAGQTPTLTELIRRGARWRPENFRDGEHFDLLPEVAGRGWFDCDDAAPALAAEIREGAGPIGQDHGARAVIRRSGDKTWHALVEKSDGEILDPSTWGGMPPTKTLPLAKPIWPTGVSGAYVARRPGRPGWSARCDLPMDVGHIVGVAYDCETPGQALARAVAGVGLSHCDGGRCAQLSGQVIGEYGALLSAHPGGGLERGEPMMVRF